MSNLRRPNTQSVPYPWVPPPQPRILNRGMQGGKFTLDRPEWIPVLRQESMCPDEPSSPTNDHYRTVFVQVPPGPLTATVDDETVALGVLLRVKFGVGNGQMVTFVDVPPDGILHIPLTAESVLIDAATVVTFLSGTITQAMVDNPTPVLADQPPEIVVGVLQDQALSPNAYNQPKRCLNVKLVATQTEIVPIPIGAQSVTVLGDSSLVAKQLDSVEASIPMPVNVEVPISAGMWQISLTQAGNGSAGVVFGLGI